MVVALHVHAHGAVIEHSDGRRRVAFTQNWPVRAVTRDALGALRGLIEAVPFNPAPQETSWSVPLDDDDEHATYDIEQVGAYLEAATSAARVLAELRAPYRGRSTPVNAWWGSFDLASACSAAGRQGRPPAPSSSATPWTPKRSLWAGGLATSATPAPPSTPMPIRRHARHRAQGRLEPEAARWDIGLGEYLVEWDDIRGAADPYRVALAFARSAVRHACRVCEWDPVLAGSLELRRRPCPGVRRGAQTHTARRSSSTGMVRIPAVFSAYSAKFEYRRACSA